MGMQEQWDRVAAEGRKNDEVVCVRPRKWTRTHEKLARKIDAYIDSDWDLLVEAVRCATTGGAESRLVLDLDRLASNDCYRLDCLLSGTWEDSKKAKERRLELESAELKEIEKKRKSAVEDELERWDS